VTYDKQTVWELGGTVLRSYKPSSLFPYPTYVSSTRSGNLLITEWGANKVVEVVPWMVPPRELKEAQIFHDYDTKNDWGDSDIFEARGYQSIAVQVFNSHPTATIDYELYTSPDAVHWHRTLDLTTILPTASDEQRLAGPIGFVKLRTKSHAAGAAGTITAFVAANR